MIQDPGGPQAATTSPMSDALRELASRGELRHYRKGRILIEEGDRGETIYIIHSGRVRAYCAAANGREITFGLYGPGEYLGEMSLDGGVRSANVETVEDTVCSVVTRDAIRAFIGERPDFAFDLLAKVIRRARAATLSAKNLALNDVYGRLKQLLESHDALEQADGARVLRERLTQKDLAQRLGCSREMVSRVMKDLENGGYIRMAEGRIVVGARLPARW